MLVDSILFLSSVSSRKTFKYYNDYFIKDVIMGRRKRPNIPVTHTVVPTETHRKVVAYAVSKGITNPEAYEDVVKYGFMYIKEKIETEM